MFMLIQNFVNKCIYLSLIVFITTKRIRNKPDNSKIVFTFLKLSQTVASFLLKNVLVDKLSRLLDVFDVPEHVCANKFYRFYPKFYKYWKIKTVQKHIFVYRFYKAKKRL